MRSVPGRKSVDEVRDRSGALSLLESWLSVMCNFIEESDGNVSRNIDARDTLEASSASHSPLFSGGAILAELGSAAQRAAVGRSAGASPQSPASLAACAAFFVRALCRPQLPTRKSHVAE